MFELMNRNLALQRGFSVESAVGHILPYACPSRLRGLYAQRLGHRRAAAVRGIGRSFPHGLPDHLESDLSGQPRHPLRPRLVPREPRHARTEILLPPAPDLRHRHAHPPRDRDSAVTTLDRQTDLEPPGKFAQCVVVAQPVMKLSVVVEAKEKAYVRATYPPITTHHGAFRGPMFRRGTLGCCTVST
jgi:hypothetical protein